MTATDLLDASRGEQALYAALVATYREFEAALADGEAPIDAAVVLALRARSEELTAALRAVGEGLAPVRLAGTPVPAGVAACWRATAERAAEAALACRRLTERARAQQAAIAVRLRTLAAGRRGLAGYRPAADPGGAVATERA